MMNYSSFTTNDSEKEMRTYSLDELDQSDRWRDKNDADDLMIYVVHTRFLQQQQNWKK